MDNILGLLFSKLGMLLGLIAVGAVAYLVFQNSKTSTAVSDLSAMSGGIQSLYGGNTFTGITNTIVTQANLAPSDMTTGAGVLVNPWGGTVTVAVNGANAAQFDVTETLVPEDACGKLAQDLTYQAVSINGTAMAMPVTPTQAVPACAGTNPATMILTFSH